MKNQKWVFILAAFAIFFSCRKDNSSPSKNVAVKFEGSYIQLVNIDSAFVTWEIAGNKQTAKMVSSGSELRADVASFTHGSGLLSIQLYSNKVITSNPSGFGEPHSYVLQFEYRTTLVLDGNNINITGPLSFNSSTWLPRVLLDDIFLGNRYTALVALMPSDPFFALKNIPADREYTISLQRLYGENSEVITSKTIDLPEATNLEDRESFVSLVAGMGSSDWNRGIIQVEYTTPQDDGAILLFEYDRVK
jgi:hypothetical protein